MVILYNNVDIECTNKKNRKVIPVHMTKQIFIPTNETLDSGSSECESGIYKPYIISSLSVTAQQFLLVGIWINRHCIRLIFKW